MAQAIDIQKQEVDKEAPEVSPGQASAQTAETPAAATATEAPARPETDVAPESAAQPATAAQPAAPSASESAAQPATAAQPAATPAPNTPARPSTKKIVGGVLGFIIAAIVYFACGNVGLEHQGVICLAILSWAIVWWVAGVLPEYATGLLMVAGFAIIGGVDSSVSFAAFSTSTWWLLIAAFALGAGMKTSGLMKRMALAIIRAFPNTFSAQVGGLMAVGTILGPLVPSLATKTAMLTPIAMSMGDEMGYQRKGREMQGLFLAMLAGVRNIGPAVISASVIGYALWGLMPDDVRAQFDMLHWFLAALPWFIIVTVLNYAAIVTLYRPRSKDKGKGKGKAASRKVDAAASEEPATDSAPATGGTPAAVTAPARPAPMSRHEKQMLAIILITVILWVAEPLHGIASHIVALVALVAMVACGIMPKTSFKKDISWDSLIFIGTAIGLSSVFSAVGIQDWIVSIAGPVFQSLSSNPYAFVLGIGVITIFLRFVIVSEMAYVNIVMVFLIPLAVSQGINPWVVGMTVYAVVNPWFALYQNPVYLAAYYSVDGEMVRHSDMAKYCVLYMVFCLIALAASVPYWQFLGLM